VAVQTGAHFLEEDQLQGDWFEKRFFGGAKQIVVDVNETQIVSGQGGEQQLAERVQRIREQIQEEDSEAMKNNHRQRLARMEHRIAEIQCGGRTEVEQGEERDKIVDCMNSVKQAIEQGVLPGGGSALFHTASYLE